MLLIASTLSCQKEQLEPTADVADPKHTTALSGAFFEFYEPNVHPFTDEVVSWMQKHEQESGYCSEFAKKYGTPLWHVVRPITVEKVEALLVPVQVREENSLSAILCFARSKDGGISLYVYYPNTPGPNREVNYNDLFLFYHTLLFGHPADSKRFILIDGETPPPPPHSRQWIVDTYCWTVAASFDGGNSWTINYQVCVSTYTYIGEEEVIIDGDGGGSADGGGGGSDGSLITINKDHPDLQSALQALLNQYCPNGKFVQQMFNSINKFFLNSNLGSNGAYCPITNNIYFSSWGNVKPSTLLHELFHAWQNDRGYEMGPGQDGYVNKEFEAWLYTDLWARAKGGWVNNQHSSWSGRLPANLRKDYVNWLTQILNNPTQLLNQSSYLTWLNHFNQVMPEYSSQIDENLGNNILNAFTLCNLIN